MSEVLSLLRQLIACPSVTPDDAGCQAIVAARLGSVGFECRTIAEAGVTNLWATHGSGAPLFCLAGHTDVVPPGPLDSWLTGPFEPTLDGGFLRGRGAQDMKAGVAAMVVAAERIAQEGHAGTLAVLLTSDEEGPAIQGTRLVLERLTQEGVRLDAALVGEPTSSDRLGDKIKVGRRGSVTAYLTSAGIQGHTAYPHLASNAAHPLVESLSRILALDWGGPTDHFPATTLQVTHLSTGTSTANVIPGSAEAWLNLRFGTNWTSSAIAERLAACLKEGISMRVQAGVDPFLTEEGPLVLALEAAVEEVLGNPPARATDGGTSDARFFAQFGVPVVEFGTRNDSIHAVNERVAVDELEPLARVYGALARRVLQ